MSTYLSLDAQRRLSLGRLIPKGIDGFLVEQQSDGRFILTPASPVPTTELPDWLLDEVRDSEKEILAGKGSTAY
jgi:hypothetical protein